MYLKKINKEITREVSDQNTNHKIQPITLDGDIEFFIEKKQKRMKNDVCREVTLSPKNNNIIQTNKKVIVEKLETVQILEVQQKTKTPIWSKNKLLNEAQFRLICQIDDSKLFQMYFENKTLMEKVFNFIQCLKLKVTKSVFRQCNNNFQQLLCATIQKQIRTKNNATQNKKLAQDNTVKIDIIRNSQLLQKFDEQNIKQIFVSLNKKIQQLQKREQDQLDSQLLAAQLLNEKEQQRQYELRQQQLENEKKEQEQQQLQQQQQYPIEQQQHAYRLNEELMEKQQNKIIGRHQERIEQLELEKFKMEEEKECLTNRIELLEFQVREEQETNNEKMKEISRIQDNQNLTGQQRYSDYEADKEQEIHRVKLEAERRLAELESQLLRQIQINKTQTEESRQYVMQLEQKDYQREQQILQVQQDMADSQQVSLQSEISHLQNRLSKLEEEREQERNLNSDTLQDYRQQIDNLQTAKQSIEMTLQEANQEIDQNNQDRQQKEDEQKVLEQEQLQNTTIIQTLETQINTNNEINIKEMEKQRQILERTVVEFERERQDMDTNKSQLIERVRELEEASRLEQQANLSLRGEYQRLQEVLTTSLNQVIQDTLQQHQ